MNCSRKFYTYAIFVSWVIVFFAVLAIFYSFMETGSLISSPSYPEKPNHIFEWMKEDITNKEHITDMTYTDNKKLEQNIANLKDPIYQIALNALHMQELSLQNGPPYPGLYYVEPFSNNDREKSTLDFGDFKNEFTFQNSPFEYGSGSKYLESFYARKERKDRKKIPKKEVIQEVTKDVTP